MNLLHSQNLRPSQPDAQVAAILETIGPERLRRCVMQLALPRHFLAEAEQNRRTADWIAAEFEILGYRTERQGAHNNIIASSAPAAVKVVLVGAHFDSVPGSPAADDNASAVAAMLGCAAACRLWNNPLPLLFVAFNREEEGLLGSSDFVKSYLPEAGFQVQCAHVLEMVGYASSAPRSQRIPTGLPIQLNDVGDFLGLLANGQSANVLESALRNARTYSDLPVSGLAVPAGADKVLPVLGRSDHVPFWQASIPALLWTDTAEFRNPHYHTATDLPETLNYIFLSQVTQVLTSQVLTQASLL